MKNKKVLILSIIAIILVVSVGITMAYFTTDMLKTEQQLFYKYIAQTNTMNSDIIQQLNVTNDKISINSNSSSANLEVALAKPNQETGISDIQKILTITSNGLKNNLTKQSYRDFSFFMENQNFLTLKYLRDDKTYGISIDNILAKYLAVENSNLKELFRKLGVEDTANIPDTIPTNYEEILKIDKATLNQLKETYTSIIYNSLKQEKFYKIKNSDKTEIIGVSLTEQEVVDVLKLILENAKNDNVFLNLIINKAQLLNYNDLTIENIQAEIQTYIDEIINKTYSTDNEFINISLVKKNKNIIKLIFETNYKKETYEEGMESDFQELQQNYNNRIEIDFSQVNKYTIVLKENDIELMNCAIDYSYDDNNITFNVDLESKVDEKNNSIKVQYQINNYKTDNIIKNILINLNDNTEENYQITYTNNINLKQDVQISKLTTENSVKLNDLTAEQISQIFDTLLNKIMEKYGYQFMNSAANIYSETNQVTNDAIEVGETISNDMQITAQNTINAINSY